MVPFCECCVSLFGSFGWTYVINVHWQRALASITACELSMTGGLGELESTYQTWINDGLSVKLLITSLAKTWMTYDMRNTDL